MPSVETNIVQNVCKAIQYTGSNSADIDAQVPNCSIVSETGGVLTVNVNGREFPIPTNGWVYWSVFVADSLSNSQYNSEWGRVALGVELDSVVLDLDDVSDRVSALETAGAVRAMGVAPIPTLLASGTTTVNVQLQPAMADTGYSAYASTFAGVSLANLVVNSVTVVDNETVAVSVTNTGLVSLTGASVMVHAID